MYMISFMSHSFHTQYLNWREKYGQTSTWYRTPTFISQYVTISTVIQCSGRVKRDIHVSFYMCRPQNSRREEQRRATRWDFACVLLKTLWINLTPAVWVPTMDGWSTRNVCLSALFKNDSSSWLQTEETPPDLGTDRGERKERQVCSFFFVWEEFTQEIKRFLMRMWLLLPTARNVSMQVSIIICTVQHMYLQVLSAPSSACSASWQTFVRLHAKLIWWTW